MKIRVGWYCSLYVGAPYWHGTEIYEPDECDTAFETIEEETDWDEKACSATCPKCHQQLDQEYDEPWFIEYVDGGSNG